MFAVYFASTWAGSMRSGATRSLFLLGLWLALGCLAIAGWTGSGGWMIAGGYLGLICALLAFATGVTEIARFGRNTNLNADEPRVVRPMAAD